MATSASLELHQFPAQILPGILRLVIHLGRRLGVFRLLAKDQGVVEDQEYGSIPNSILMHGYR